MSRHPTFADFTLTQVFPVKAGVIRAYAVSLNDGSAAPLPDTRIEQWSTQGSGDFSAVVEGRAVGGGTCLDEAVRALREHLSLARPRPEPVPA